MMLCLEELDAKIAGITSASFSPSEIKSLPSNEFACFISG
jgi:hypothetical protein